MHVRSLSNLFSEHARSTNDEHLTIKASMGDLVSLYGLLRHFVEVSACRDDARIAVEIYNFKLVCSAVDLLIATKRRQLPIQDAGRQLLVVLERHLQSHVAAHGNRRVRPKTHWAFDVAQCMVDDDYLMDAFTTERLHQRVKQVANNCKNLQDYEGSVMAGVTNVHARALAADLRPAGLVGTTAALDGGIVVADRCRYYGVHLSVHDFVFRGASAAWLRWWLGWVSVGVLPGSHGWLRWVWLVVWRRPAQVGTSW